MRDRRKSLTIDLPELCGECCFGEFMSGGSSLNDTDFSNETDLSATLI